MTSPSATPTKSTKQAHKTTAKTPKSRRSDLASRIDRLQKYACKILTDPDRYLVCVPYGDIRPEPTNGDIVHVRRTVGSSCEDLLGVVDIAAGRIRLRSAPWPQVEPGAPPRRKGAPAAQGSKAHTIDYPAPKSGEKVEIMGLVVGYQECVPF